MKNRIVNIACLSVGKHAQKNIIPMLKENKNFNLIGIYTRNKKTCQLLKEEYSFNIYDSEEDLMNDDTIDAIYISSPLSEHFRQCIKCINSNKNIIIEKSAFSNLKDASYIIDEANKRNLVVMEAFMYKYHEQLNRIKKIIDNNIYGETLHINIEFGFPHLKTDDIRYSKMLDGGALNDVGAYVISAITVFGDKNLKLESANISYENDIDVDTRGYCVYKYDTNKIITGQWLFGGSYRNRIEIWTNEFNIKSDKIFSKTKEYEPEIIIEKNGKIAEKLKIKNENHFENMFNRFQYLINMGDISNNIEIINQSKHMHKIRNIL